MCVAVAYMSVFLARSPHEGSTRASRLEKCMQVVRHADHGRHPSSIIRWTRPSFSVGAIYYLPSALGTRRQRMCNRAPRGHAVNARDRITPIGLPRLHSGSSIKVAFGRQHAHSRCGVKDAIHRTSARNNRLSLLLGRSFLCGC